MQLVQHQMHTIYGPEKFILIKYEGEKNKHDSKNFSLSILVALKVKQAVLRYNKHNHKHKLIENKVAPFDGIFD